MIVCDLCKNKAMWNRDRLEALPPEATIGELAARLRCDTCGATEGVIYTQQAHEHWEQRNA